MDVVVLRAVLTGDASGVSGAIAQANKEITDFASKTFNGPKINAQVTGTNGAPGASPTGAPSTKDPAKVAATTAAAVEQVEKTSQARRAAIVAEGEARRGATQGAGAARVVNIQNESNARLEAQERAHQQRMGQIAQQAARRPAGMAGAAAAMQMGGMRNLQSGAMMSAMVTAPIIGAGTAGIGLLRDYQEKLAATGAMTNVTAAQFKNLSSQILNLASDDRIRQTPAQLAEGLFFVTSTVSDTSEAMQVLKNASIGASAGLGNTKTVASVLTSEMAAYGDKAETTAHSVDVLTEATKFGKARADSMAGAFARVIPLGSQLGVTFEELAANLSTMTRLGFSADEAGTGLQNLLNKLAAPTKGGKNALAKMGYTPETLQADIKSEGLMKVLLKIKEAAGGSIAPLKDLFGNVRGLNNILATAARQPKVYAESLEAMQRANGTTNQSVKVAADTIGFQMDRVEASFQASILKITTQHGPRLTAMLKGWSHDVPEAIDRVVAAWDALGPAGQKAAIILLTLAAAAGPIKILAGSVQYLGSMVLGLGAGLGTLLGLQELFTALSLLGPAIAAGGIGEIAAGLGLVGTALLPLIAVLGALVVAYEVVSIAIDNHTAAVNDAATAVHNYEMSVRSVNKHLANMAIVSGQAGEETRAGLKKLGDDAKGAGKDTGKLLAVLREAVAMRVAVGKDMHLDAAGKAVVTAEINRMISDLSSRTINLKVNVDKEGNAKPEVVAAVARAAGKPLTPDQTFLVREGDWQERARKAGVALPPEPARTVPTEAWFGPDNPNPDYEKQTQARIAARQKIIDWEKAHPISSPAATQATQNQTVALTEQTKAVEDLKDAELKREKTRLGALVAKNGVGDGEAYTRYLKVSEETNTRKGRIQESWQKTLAERAAAEQKANQERETREQEIQSRLAAIEQKSLQDRLQMWNSFGNAVEGVARNLEQVGAEGADKEKLAVAAQMAKREFADIPPHLKAIVVGIAAINDRMRELTRTRDEVRGLFSDLFKDAIKSGADLGPLTQAAAFMDKRLDYERKMNGLHSRGARASESVINQSEAQRSGLSSHIEQLSAQRSASGAASVGTAAAGGPMPSYLQAMSEKVGGSIGEQCGTTISTFLRKSGVSGTATTIARSGNARPLADGTYAPGSIFNFQGGKPGYRVNHYATVAPDGKHWLESNWYAKNKITNTRPINWQRDIAAATWDGRTNIGFPGGSPMSSSAQKASASTQAPPSLTVKKERSYDAPDAPGYKGNLLQMGLPKGWGKAVTDTGLRANESRSWQMRLQEMLADTDKAKTTAASFGMSLNEYAKTWRRIAARQDLADSGARAREAMRGQLRELDKSTRGQKRFSGRENAYASTLDDMEHGGYDFLTGGERQNLLLQTRANLLAQSAAQSRNLRGTEADNQKVLAAGRPLLQGITTDLAKYNREIEEAKIRVEAWARVQPLLDMADEEERRGDKKNAQATRRRAHEQFRAEVNATTTTLNTGASDAGQVDYTRDQQARKDSISLLQFELDLLEKGVQSQNAIARAVEVEKVRREALKKLLDANPEATPDQIAGFEGQAKTAGNEAGQSFDAGAGRDRVGDQNAAKRNAARELVRLQKNAALITQYGSDSPTLRYEMEMGRATDELDQKYDSKTDAKGKRSTADQKSYKADLARAQARVRAQIAFDLSSDQIKAEQDAATATLGSQRDVANATAKSNAERVANEIDYQNKVRALRGQSAMSAKEENELIKQSDLSAQSDRIRAVTEAKVATLDAERAVKDATATNAAERLEVEKWYQSEVRKLRGQEPMSADEEAEMGKQSVFKGQGEEMDKIKRRAEQTRDIFRDSIRDGFDQGINKGLAGLGKKVLDAMVDSQIDKTVTGITRGMYGDKSMPDSEASGGVDILGAIFGRRSKRIEVPTAVPIASGTPLLPGTDLNSVGVPGYLRRAEALTNAAPIASAITSGPASFLSQVPSFLSAIVGNPAVARAASSEGAKESASGGKLMSATFHIASATQTISRATINARSSTGASGGGAGTSKSGDQILGDVFGVAGMFA